MKRLLVTAALFVWTLGAQQHPLQELIETARAESPGLKDLLAKRGNLAQGGVWVWGQDFLFAAQADGAATVSIDSQPAVTLTKAAGSNLAYRLVKMRTGVTHSYQFYVDGKAAGTRRDVAGYNPDSYPKAGVPKGTLSEKKTITSKLYPGATADYWIYASPGVDPAKPSPLMVWQDGQGVAAGADLSGLRLFTVTENLIAQKLLPPIVYVMISPAINPAETQPNRRSLRSIQYDTVSDKFGHYLMDEVLPEVEKTYKLRPDGYSRAIAGESSGAICAFNVAWFFPDKFSRVHSAIGSYTSIQWRPDEKQDGGNVYPFRVRRDPKKNIRIWMSDGVEDIENNFGSWPLQNLQLANSLKMKGYDYHYRLGEAAHNGSQAALDLPESLTWLWRGYDASKTEQPYEQDPAEKDKPLYRIKLLNRDAW